MPEFSVPREPGHSRHLMLHPSLAKNPLLTSGHGYAASLNHHHLRQPCFVVHSITLKYPWGLNLRLWKEDMLLRKNIYFFIEDSQLLVHFWKERRSLWNSWPVGRHLEADTCALGRSALGDSSAWSPTAPPQWVLPCPHTAQQPNTSALPLTTSQTEMKSCSDPITLISEFSDCSGNQIKPTDPNCSTTAYHPLYPSWENMPANPFSNIGLPFN